MSVLVETADEARKRKAEEVLVKATVGVVLLPLEAWILMLVLGAVHGIVAPVAAVGYGTAFLFALGFDLLAHLVRKLRPSGQ